MKKVYPILILTIAWLLVFPAMAAEEPGYDGFLIQVRTEDASLFSSLPNGIDAVAPGAGIYHTDTLEDTAFFPSEEILCIEPNYFVELFDTEETNDEAWNLHLMGVDTAGRTGIDGSGVRIGVIDSGLYAEHEALAETRIIQGHNYIKDNNDISDDVGHGTFVAGIITAVAPGAEVVPLKSFDSRTGTMKAIIAAIYDSVDNYSCDILNMSFGLSTDSEILSGAVQYAAGKGTVLTAAVGNDGTSKINYPAGYDEVIGVGMLGADKTVGVKSQRNASVFFTAPGVEVTGPGTDGPSAYRTGTGTSYACPHVAAVAALLMQAVPDMTPEDVCAALTAGAEDLGEPGYDEIYGYGLLSATKMLAALPPLPVKTNTGILLRVVRFLSDETPQVWAASYSDTGRMLACRTLSASIRDGVLAVSGVLPPLADTAQVKLFFLCGEHLKPALEMESVQP